MTQLLPRSAAEAVANGAQLLDEKQPGWWRSIDLGSLRLSSCTSCICGQLATTTYRNVQVWTPASFFKAEVQRYLSFVNELFGTRYLVPWTNTMNRKDITHGFNEPKSLAWTYAELETEWEAVITARLQADQMASTVVEREVECALT